MQPFGAAGVRLSILMACTPYTAGALTYGAAGSSDVKIVPVIAISYLPGAFAVDGLVAQLHAFHAGGSTTAVASFDDGKSLINVDRVYGAVRRFGIKRPDALDFLSIHCISPLDGLTFRHRSCEIACNRSLKAIEDSANLSRQAAKRGNE